MKRRSFLGFDPSLFAAAALFFAVPGVVLGGGFVSPGAPLAGTGISVSGTTVSVDQTSSLTWTGTETFNTHAVVLGTSLQLAKDFNWAGDATPVEWIQNGATRTMKDSNGNSMGTVADIGTTGAHGIDAMRPIASNASIAVYRYDGTTQMLGLDPRTGASSGFIVYDNNMSTGAGFGFASNGTAGFRQVAFNSLSAIGVSAVGFHDIYLQPAANYGIVLGSSGTKVACAAGNRGTLFYEAGGSGVADVVYICSHASDNSYAWRDIAAAIP